jgi:hypothetical protein
MNQPWRLPMVLCLSVLFGSPALGAMLRSPAELPTAGPRYVGALVLAWAGVTAIGRMIERFAVTNRLAELEEPADPPVA